MTYVISDICGNYQKFKELMDNVLINDSDTLYVLGNTVDFGDEPMELIEDISMRSNVYAVAGARDYLAARMLISSISSIGSSPKSTVLPRT